MTQFGLLAKANFEYMHIHVDKLVAHPQCGILVQISGVCGLHE